MAFCIIYRRDKLKLCGVDERAYYWKDLYKESKMFICRHEGGRLFVVSRIFRFKFQPLLMILTENQASKSYQETLQKIYTDFNRSMRVMTKSSYYGLACFSPNLNSVENV